MEGYRQAAERVAGLGPAVVIQEGGYDLAAIGESAGRSALPVSRLAKRDEIATPPSQ